MRSNAFPSLAAPLLRHPGPARATLLRCPGAARAALLCAAAFVAACGDSGPPPPTPTSINVFPARADFDAVGDTRSFAANVRDQNGVAMDGEPVTWTSSNPAVVSVDANGRARAEGNGTAVIRAVAREATGEAPVTVTQVPAALERLSGDGQESAAGTALPIPLAVEVRDRLGGAIGGQTVAFSVIGGGGSVEPATAQTDAQGRAQAVWTLGPRAGEPQGARAAIDGSAVPGIAFSAVGFAGPPAELRSLSGADQVGLVGTPLPIPLSVQVLDAFENPLPAEVAFNVVSGGGSVSPQLVTTGLLGTASATWTLGSTPGEQRMRASSGALTWEFRATAATTSGPPATLEIVSGDGQEAAAGSALGDPLIVAVRDAQGIGVQGIPVTFTASEGSVAPSASTTNASGLAATTWTLGTTVGPQSADATVAALGTVTFDADARDPGPTCVLSDPDAGGFDIQICFVTPVSATVAAAFENARLRWEELITGDIPDLPPNPDASSSCGGPTAPPIQGALLDDVVIYATIEEIDGEFNVLGSAGPCFIRDSGFLTSVGRMRFDVADLDRLADGGSLEDVILHEMGHVLGIGTLWSVLGFLQNAAPAGQQPPGPDTHFNGPLAIAAFNAAGGQNRTAGQKVPVQNVGNAGSINGHWRESTVNRELMTPFLEQGANPLSIISVQSLADLGYQVSNAGADAYTVESVNGVAAPTDDDRKIPLVDDIWWMPLRVVDESGRVVRILPAGGG